jgi:hypothetical protein
MTPPLDPDTLAKLRSHIAAVALATAATAGAVGCKKDPPPQPEHPVTNDPMPHTMNPPIPMPTAQELANLPSGRTAPPPQDPNEPANLPDGGSQTATPTATPDAGGAINSPADGGAVAPSGTVNPPRPTPNTPARPVARPVDPPGNG